MVHFENNNIHGDSFFLKKSSSNFILRKKEHSSCPTHFPASHDSPCYSYSKTNQIHQCIIYLFWNGTLHVSDGLSVHHQQFKTLHTAVKHILLSASKQTVVSVSDKCLLQYLQSLTPDDGRKDRTKHAECHSKIKKFDTLVHLVGFTVEIILRCTAL